MYLIRIVVFLEKVVYENRRPKLFYEKQTIIFEEKDHFAQGNRSPSSANE
jgi:hypothetical protein